MSSSLKKLLAIVVVWGASACSDLTPSDGNTLALNTAFQTIPVGFSANSNSFDPTGDIGQPFFPGPIDAGVGYSGGPGGNSNRGGGAHEGGKDHRDGFGGGIRGLLMGGGFGPDFLGAIAFGRGKGRGPFGVFHLPDDCTFSETTGRVTCPEQEKHGLAVNVSFAFKNTAGEAQATFDTATTNSVNVRTSVAGTKTRREGTSTSTVSHASDRTVTGLAAGSTQRTVNGTAVAHETTTGARESVTFTAVRDAVDTTKNLVIPIAQGKHTIPTSGTVIRAMTISITPEGGAATTHSRREEATFDGTNVIKVKITQDGTTKNCSITLPARKLVCE